MTNSTATELQFVFADYGPASLLRRKTIVPDGFEMNFIDTGTPVQGMARMVRGLEFDVVDMSPTTFLAARALGVPLVAMPITMYAEYPHALLWTHKASNIRKPADLAGKTIGGRTWLNPASLWMRGMLAEQFGVALDSVKWSLTVADTLEVVPLPPNAQRTLSEPKAFKLLEMVHTGECDAVIDALTVQWHHALEQKRVDTNLVQPLWPDDHDFTTSLHKHFGYIPIMHMVVVKGAMLEQHPNAARVLFETFGRAKEQYFANLRSGNAPAGDREAWLVARDRDNRELLELGIDPLPMGDAVVDTVEKLMHMMVKHGYLTAPIDIRAQFAPVR